MQPKDQWEENEYFLEKYNLNYMGIRLQASHLLSAFSSLIMSCDIQILDEEIQMSLNKAEEHFQLNVEAYITKKPKKQILRNSCRFWVGFDRFPKFVTKGPKNWVT